MDVVFPAHGPCVAEAGRHLIERRIDVLLRFLLAGWRTEFPEGTDHQHRPAPGPEVFRRDVAPGHQPQVVVHIVRVDAVPLPVPVHVLEQLLPRQVLELTDDPGEALVDDIHGVPNPALSMELEMQGVSADLDVLATERREAVRAVGLPVLVVADADQGRVEKADERSKELSSRQAGQ